MYYTPGPIQIKLEIKRVSIRASDFSFLSIRRLSERQQSPHTTGWSADAVWQIGSREIL